MPTKTLGLAAACLAVPKWSDMIKRRKLPAIAGTLLPGVLVLLLYSPVMSATNAMILCFVFGVGNAAHMLAFTFARVGV